MLKFKRSLSSTAVACALMAGSVVTMADTDKLTITGFIDMSTAYVKPDDDAIPSTSTGGLDQVELDFLYALSDKMSANIDLEYSDDGGTAPDGTALGEETDVEQAYFTNKVSDTVSVKAGRFLSYSGFEAEEPTGLFQYSGAGYAKYFYGGYQQGASTLYSSKKFDAAISVVNDLGDLQGMNRATRHPAIETMLAFKPTDSVALKAFYSTDQDSFGETTSVMNLWGSYAANGLTLALETSTADNAGAAAGFGSETKAAGSMAMANYTKGKFGVTLRMHSWNVEDKAGDKVEEMSGVTLAPSFKANDNLLLILEYRTDKDKIADAKTDTVALEATVTF